MGQSQILYRFQNGLQADSQYIVTPVYGSSANTIAQGNDARFSISQVVRVKKNPGAGEFSTINAALASITDAAANKVYLIDVGPGDYTETQITMKPYVYINGVFKATRIIADDPASDLIIADSNCGITNCILTGTTTAALFLIDNTLRFVVIGCEFEEAETFARFESTVGPTRALFQEILFYNASGVVNGFDFAATGANVIAVQFQNVFGTTPNGASNLFNVDGQNVNILMNNVQSQGVGAGSGTAINIQNGGDFSGTGLLFIGFNNGLVVGGGPNLSTISLGGLNILNSVVKDIDIQSTNCEGFITGAFKNSKTTRATGSQITIAGADPNVGYFVNNQSVLTASPRNLSVRSNPGPNEFSTIESAIAYAVSQTPSFLNNFIINVSDGVYNENPLTVPSWVTIRGAGSFQTFVNAINLDAPLFSMEGNTSLEGMYLTGGNGTNATLVTILSAVNTQVGIYACSFGNCQRGIVCKRPDFGSVIVAACTLGLNASFVDAFIDCGDAAGINQVSLLNFYGVIGTTEFFARATGPNSSLNMSNVTIQWGTPGTLDTLVYATDGVQLGISSSVFLGVLNNGIVCPAVGTGPSILLTDISMLTAITLMINILNPGTTGFISGNFDTTKVVVDDLAQLNIFAVDPVNVGIGMSILGDIFQGTTIDNQQNITNLLRTESTVGLINGGNIIDDGALDITAEAGSGFIIDTNNSIKFVQWVDTPFTLLPDTDNFVLVNDAGTVILSNGFSTDPTSIYLGRVVTDATGKRFIENLKFTMTQYGNKIEEYLTYALGSIFTNGCTVTASTNIQRAVNITAGLYYFGTTKFEPASGLDILFDQYYRDPPTDWTVTAAQQQFINDFYDNNTGTLAPVTAGYFTKHLLLMLGDGPYQKYFVVIAQAEYPTLLDAETADLPSVPTYFDLAVVRVASVIMQEGTNAIISIRDERPRIGFAPSATSGSAVHGNLLGLLADDHTQYLLADGTRAMAGNLNMGTNQITNAGQVNGVTVQAHASRHLPAGADPLTTAAPTTNINASTTNQTGLQNSLSRSDHQHGIDTGAPVAIVPAASNQTGISSTLARSDHVHALATAAPANIIPDQVAAQGVATSLSRSDHVHNIATAAPSTNLSANTTNQQGTSNNFSRADHVHAVNTGTPVTQTPAQANAAGTSPNLARADHVHDIPVGTPVALTPDQINDPGLAATFVRSDHVHNIPTAAPSGTLAPNSANAQGAAATFARSDHSHAFAIGTPVTQNPAQANAAGTANSFARSDHIHNIPTAAAATLAIGDAAAEGVSTNFARADHVHAVPAGTPVTVGTANAEGNATTFARSNHVHSHGDQAGGTLHAVATQSTPGFLSAADKVKLDVSARAWMQYSNSTLFTFNNAAFVAATQLDTDQSSFLGGYFDKPNATDFRTLYAGHVKVTSNMVGFSNTNNRGWSIALFKNGTQIGYLLGFAISQNTTQRQSQTFFSGVVTCAVNDVFTIRYVSPEGLTTSVGANQFMVLFEVERINP